MQMITKKTKFFDSLAKDWDKLKSRNKYYYRDIEKFLGLLIPKNKKVLEIGCATGDLLKSLDPSKGLGIDISLNMISIAKKKHKRLDFKVMDAENLKLKEKFDYIIMSDVIGSLSDVWQAFRELHKVCNNDTKIIISYKSRLLMPILKLAEALRLKAPSIKQNSLYLADIENLLHLNHFKVVRTSSRLLMPKYIPVISAIFNKYIAKLPLLRNLCLAQYVIARKEQSALPSKDYSVTIMIPCRNEKGNIEDAVKRIPKFGAHQEILFVDGNSTDGTVEEIKRVKKEYKGKDIRLIHQGKIKGKEYAVRKGFMSSSGEIVMGLDADLAVAPEDLPKFYLALKEGKAQFVIGSRLIYPMEKGAMRAINFFGNWMFGKILSWIIEQRIRDGLCGTKVLFKKDYMALKEYRKYFDSMDPFGDFDHIFGASKMNLDIKEIPIIYRARKYGGTKIRRFYHGFMLMRLCLLGMRKLKFN